jgi:predicted ATP-grasp superfamily ATP-dependent carboligase
VLVERGTRAARSRYVDATVAVPDATGNGHRYLTAVSACAAAERVDVVVPSTDASLQRLWDGAAALCGARILGCDRASFRRLLDKADCLTAAQNCGFPTPRWDLPNSPSEALPLLRRVGLPAVVKPRRSYDSRGDRLIQRRHRLVLCADDLGSAVEESTDHAGRLPLIQEYVAGRAMSVSAVIWEGRVVAHVARETISFLPIQGGTSVWKRTVSPHDGGVRTALRLLLDLRYEGLAEVEYQLDASGTPRLMEVGLRSHGWIPLAVAAGVDLPRIAADLLVGRSSYPSRTYDIGTEMRWPKGELLRLREGIRWNPPLGTRRRDLARTAWPPWKPGMRYDGLVRDDLAPWLPGMGIRRRRERDRK